MMNFAQYIVVVLCFFGSTLYAQPNEVDSEGKKQGKWTKYYDGGKVIQYMGQFVDDEPIGQFVYYRKTGELSAIMEHQSDGKSYCKVYHVNGNIMAHGNYEDQKKDSIWWYFNDKKEIIRKENYENGTLNGINSKFYPARFDEKRVVLEAVNYVNGLEQGEWKRYSEKGKIIVEGQFVDGLEQGQFTWYTESGKHEMIGFYKKGKKNGWWREYEDGNESEKYYYLNGYLLEGEQLEKHLEFKKKNTP